MKKITVLSFLALMLFCGYLHAAGNKVLALGAKLSALPPTNTSVDVSTSTVYKITAPGNGVQIMIQARGTSGSIYECKESSTAVVSTGIEIKAGSTPYIETNYMGDIWLQAEGTGPVNARIEIIQSKY